MSDRTREPDRRKALRSPSARRKAAAVSKSDSEETRRQLEKAALDHPQRYVLRLYVTGTTPASSRAVEKVRSLCEEHLQGRYELEVIDIYQRPALAKDQQIIATPTLIRELPVPLRRYIGDLKKAEKILFGMDLREKP